ncbi:hypothetical protein [Aidingimonas halophila]|uniref:Uncharacterized protein n=1 Tax=Aidingimonas halophila TaxID=574349 RepID=A0A1H3D0T2_9GAMM|nr:hypothetical protein [Aidingimonas halophila]SDX59394.1 hypothetical protein SAMN05443545_106146 [Aidingimonas halophila]
MSLPWANADPGRFAVGNRAAESIQSLLTSRALPYLSEKSAKCRPGRWSTQRCLFSVPVQAIPPDMLYDELGRLLFDLGMSRVDAETCLAPLDSCAEETLQCPHYLHLGVEDDRCKVYWEVKKPDSLPGNERFVLYRAWKWRAGESVARSDYVLLPSAREARRAIDDELQAQPDSPLHDLIEQLQVSFALAQTPWPPLTVRIEEVQAGKATGRDSLNLHLHRAGLPLGTLAGPMFSLSREWKAAARDTLISWMAKHGNEILSNLSFGRDETGQPFVTCYHGTTRHHPRHTEHPRYSDRVPGSVERSRPRSASTT